MRVLFVAPQPGHSQPFGIMMLSAVLKKSGHSTGLVSLDQRKIEQALKKDKWDILAFSISTPSYAEAVAICGKIRNQYNIYTIFGGPHATFSPEIIEEECIDAICRGEAEYALVDLVEKLEKKLPVKDTLNWWVKEEGRIFKNNVRPLIEDLDSLSPPDREIAAGYDFFTSSQQGILISRGCFFNCSYCFNKIFSDLYGSGARRVRVRSVNNVIAELKQVKLSYSPDRIAVYDDLFPVNAEWNREFCARYKSEIGLPFIVKSRPGHLTEEMTRDLKKAGCGSVIIGIEIADEELRSRVLNRRMKNETIEDCCRMIRSYGMTLEAFILCGVPDSRIEDDLDSLEYVRKLKVDFSIVSACQPYPKTAMFENLIKAGKLDPDYKIIKVDLLPVRESPIRFESKLHNRMIYNLVCLFPILQHTNFSIGLIKFLIKLPLGTIYFFCLKLWVGIIPRLQGKKKNVKKDILNFFIYMLKTY